MKTIKIKSALILSICLLSFTSFSHDRGKKKNKKQTVLIKQVSKDEEGRKLYNVTFQDGKVIQLMYMEEIKHGLKTGNWKYNDFLIYPEGK